MQRIFLAGAVLIYIAGLVYFTSFFSVPENHTSRPATPIRTATGEDKPGEKLVPAGQREDELSFPAGVPVLMYHKIGPEKNNDAVISPERFREHMAYLYEQNYRPISLDELYAYLNHGAGLPPKPVVITFDDGYRDTYEIALPLLKRYKFKSVLFIPGMEVGKSFTRDELLDMKGSGMEVAAHGQTHRPLAKLSPREQEEEISRVKESLDSVLEQDTRYFCYPYGSYDQNTMEILRKKGFRLAFTMQPGWVQPGDNPLALHRIWVGNSIDLRRLEERLTRENYSRI
ncbi:MAG TPA: polysaccharide deacetylase family protein [Desulfotomaculum sp.]|nr:polysaccharide deacetylase family protein [Desulfotomaculum sp.]